MEAWVHWNCVDAGFRNDWYNYLQTDYSWINQYDAYDEAQSGSWNSDGNVKCGLYYTG
jgi:hypothetical protein